MVRNGFNVAIGNRPAARGINKGNIMSGGATLYLPGRALLIHLQACDGRLERGKYLVRGKSRL